jgi:hypothetical protein
MTGGPGSGGLQHVLLIRTAATNRIGAHEEQHHANMANHGWNERQLQDGGGTRRSPRPQIDASMFVKAFLGGDFRRI